MLAAAPVVELQVPLRDYPGEVLWIMGVDIFSETGIRPQAPSWATLGEKELLELLLIPRSVALNRDLAGRLGLRPGSRRRASPGTSRRIGTKAAIKGYGSKN